MRLTIMQVAPPGTRYAPGAFIKGQTFTYRDLDGRAVESTLIDFTVAENGSRVELTFDVPGIAVEGFWKQWGGEG